MNYRNLISVLMMSVGLVFGQAVTGFVGNGEEPLVGANVTVEGTELGGVTDAEGSSSLRRVQVLLTLLLHTSVMYPKPKM